MIVQNHSTPWVILAVIVMAGCAISGMLLGNAGPLNTRVAEADIPVQQTQGALDSQATQSAMELAQTQQAPMIGQTAMAGQLTMIPVQQTATQAALAGQVQAIHVIATQTAIAAELQNGVLYAQATQTAIANNLSQQSLAGQATAAAIAQQQVQDQATGVAKIAIPLIGILVVTGWMVTRAVVSIMNARTQARAATAQQLAEQRRLAALRASIEAQKWERAQKYPSPASLMKRPGNGKGLPRAE
jgi:hypothetical protein